jgi:hypothetical protein
LVYSGNFLDFDFKNNKINLYECFLYSGEHEAPGRFATGLIVRRYTSGQIINVEVQITADHKGYFTFRVCPNEDFRLDKGQDCFDR